MRRPALLLCIALAGCHWVLPLYGPPEDGSGPPIDGPTHTDGNADMGDAAGADHQIPADGSGLAEGAVSDEQVPPTDKGGPGGDQAPPATACSGSFVAFLIAPPTTSSINGVACTSAKNLFAVGDAGLLLYFDGTKWVQDNSTGFAYAVDDVWSPTAGGATAYAVGFQESVLQHTGSAWSLVKHQNSSLSSLLGIWGSGPTDIWAVGSGGVYSHYNGSTWTGKTFNVGGYGLYGIWGDGTSLYIAASLGMSGKVLQWDGTSSAPQDAFVTSFRPNAIWGSGSKDIWVVGGAGKAAHFDGSSWSEQKAAALNLNAIWGSGPQQIFAVGDSGEAVCYDGTGWKPVPKPANTPVLNDVSGCGTTVLAAGGQGTLLTYVP